MAQALFCTFTSLALPLPACPQALLESTNGDELEVLAEQVPDSVLRHYVAQLVGVIAVYELQLPHRPTDAELEQAQARGQGAAPTAQERWLLGLQALTSGCLEDVGWTNLVWLLQLMVQDGLAPQPAWLSGVYRCVCGVV